MASLKINKLLMNFNDIAEAGETRSYTISGDVGAGFVFMVVTDTGQYYDFVTKTFSQGHTPQKILRKTLSSNSFTGSVVFPQVAGEAYDVIVIADPSKNTIIDKQVIVKRINQLGNVTLTFSPVSPANNSSYATLPSNVQLQSNVVGSGSSSAVIDWTIANASGSHGLIIDDVLQFELTDLNDKCWYYETTKTVNGATSSSNYVILDDVDGIAPGMTIVGVSSGSLAGTPVVKNPIDTGNKQLALGGSAQSFADGITLTFRATGLGFINTLFSCNIVSNLTSRITEVTTTTRPTGASTTVNLNGTTGIPGGNIATYIGTNVNNSSANAVTSVSASASAGSMVVQLAQTFKGFETLTFNIASPKRLCLSALLEGNISVSQMPSTDLTIKMNLDTLFTIGSAS
jgi:hypothetical protein|tara:strand:- start:3166 stop:4368 length:1203 start_codon:yes stop_codon:yes gene_type:complete